MRLRHALLALPLLGACGLLALADDDRKADAGRDDRVFELRTYVCNEGKLDDLHARFRDHTCRLFKKHGMELVGFWTPRDEAQGKADTLIYILAFPSREAADRSWQAFRDDPEWQEVYKESHKDGVIVKEVRSVFLDPADYSPIR